MQGHELCRRVVVSLEDFVRDVIRDPTRLHPQGGFDAGEVLLKSLVAMMSLWDGGGRVGSGRRVKK